MVVTVRSHRLGRRSRSYTHTRMLAQSFFCSTNSFS